MQSLIGHACTVGHSQGNVVTLGCLPIIVGNVIFWLLVFAGIVAIVLIIISGFKFVTSGGEPKRAEGARKTLTWAIIGLIVVLLSFAIVAIIAQFAGVACIRRFGFVQCVPADLRCIPRGGTCGAGFGTNCCGAAICLNVGGGTIERECR